MSKLARFDEWKADAAGQAAFMHRIAEGETPKAVCDAMGLPRSYLMQYVKATPALAAQYRSALETWVEALAHETVQIADDTEGAEDAATVAAAKLRCDTRFKIASKLYREMFGEDVKPTLSLTLNVGDVTREIRDLEARLGIGRVMDAELVETLPALPAASQPVRSEPPI